MNQYLLSPSSPLQPYPRVLPEMAPPYFKLIQLVGSFNKYQKISLVLWSVLWLVTGTILLGTPFLMYNPPYICHPNQTNFTETECQQYVCSLPTNERTQYIDQSAIKTLSTQFQDLHCQKKYLSDVMSSLVYIGCFFGYVSISVMIDNVGRYKSLILAYTVSIVGMGLTAFAFNFYVACVGLFLMGFGCDSAINICFYFITETVQDKNRQQHSILIQAFFSLGGVMNVLYFYLTNNFRMVILLFMFLPSLVCMGVVCKIIKDTPYYLVKRKKQDEALSDLVQIYKINHNGEEPPQQLTQELKQLIECLKQSQNRQTQNTQKIYTPWDLFRYKSIRFISIAIFVLSVSIYILYYGPLMLISKFSFSFSINALIVTGSELVTYPLTYFYIQKIPRQKLGIGIFGTCACIAFCLIFVISNLCETCTFLKVFQMILIFLFRFLSSLQFAVFLLYCNQILPTQIRGLGIGISSALGTLASISSPYIFGSSIQDNSGTSKIMIVFVVISILGLGFWIKLPQTLGMQIPDEIQEIKNGNDQSRQEQQKHIQLVQVKQSD